MYLFGYPKWVEYHDLYYNSESTPDSIFVDLDLFSSALDDVFWNRAPSNDGTDTQSQTMGDG